MKVQALTLKQYEQGYVDYFSVSDAQRLALENERTQIQLRGSQFRACVALIASLGGGWKIPTEDDKPDFSPPTLEKHVNKFVGDAVDKASNAVNKAIDTTNSLITPAK